MDLHPIGDEIEELNLKDKHLMTSSFSGSSSSVGNIKKMELQWGKVGYVLDQFAKERKDSTFSRTCLFCRKHFTGNRSVLLNHLMDQHNFLIGSPDNIVFINELLDHLEQMLKDLRCFYCEKIFKDWFTLKEHMRKKQHRKINPLNKSYDRFYLINYLEPGKPWQVIKDEDDSSSQDGSGQECADLELPFICLFCGNEFYESNETLVHMKDIHKFDLQQIREMYGLSYYKQIKFINYVRKKMYEKECMLCNMKFQFHEDLLKHLLETGHSSSFPESSVWDQPLYYFSTFENDHLLWSMVDENSDCEECCVYPEDVNLPPRLNSLC